MGIWTDAEVDLLKQAYANRRSVRAYLDDIVPLLPNHTKDAIQVRLSQMRISGQLPEPPAKALPFNAAERGDYNNSKDALEKADARFQEAMTTAIALGWEKAPIGVDKTPGTRCPLYQPIPAEARQRGTMLAEIGEGCEG